MTKPRAAASRAELDVAILGGGLAGNLLARQLRRTLPELRIGLFERSDRHLLQGGRGDRRDRGQLSGPQAGPLQLPVREPAAQERPPLLLRRRAPLAPAPGDERDRHDQPSLPPRLPAQPREHGGGPARPEPARRRPGAPRRRACGAIELGRAGGAAPLRGERRARASTRVRARWVVDAAGRSGLLARRKGLRFSEESHAIGSVWGRFEDVVDVDELGPEAFRARVRHTSRRLSTIHFCYPGYWIWFIPLRGGVTSVGVTGALVARQRELRTAGGLPRLSRRAPRGGLAAGRRQAARRRQLCPDRLRDAPLLPHRSLGADRRGRHLRRSAVQPRQRLHRARERLPDRPDRARLRRRGRRRSWPSAATSTTASCASATSRPCCSTPASTTGSAASSWPARSGTSTSPATTTSGSRPTCAIGISTWTSCASSSGCAPSC